MEARRTSQEIITLLCAKGDGDSDLHSSSGKCLDFEGRALKRCGQSWEGVLPNFEETNIKPGLIQWLHKAGKVEKLLNHLLKLPKY